MEDCLSGLPPWRSYLSAEGGYLDAIEDGMQYVVRSVATSAIGAGSRLSVVHPCARCRGTICGSRSGGGSCGHVRFACTSPPANLLMPLPRHRAGVRLSRSQSRETR